jgi:hypothetical protein
VGVTAAFQLAVCAAGEQARQLEVRLGHADPRGGAAARLPADLQTADGRHVALIGEAQQIEQKRTFTRT